ncbi:MAG: DUF5011 domain-containing protein [Saprospiraceae bacterium]|nr:DUF5011 domain-containing protein [Saprospiraceae bacterium]
MKVIYFSLFLAFFAFSCENDPGIEASTETFLPKIELKGASSISLPCGTTSFTDPGVTATENGQPAQLAITVNPRYFGSTTVNTSDVYDISYVATNKDGIPGAVFRSVTIPPCNGDMVSNLEGTYTSTIVRTNNGNGSTLTGAQYTNMEYVYIKNIGGNKYKISDALGGWYEFGRQLGVAYAAPGHEFTANNIATNDFSFGSAVVVGGFGGPAQITSLNVDPATKSIEISTLWSGSTKFTFAIKLTQVN